MAPRARIRVRALLRRLHLWLGLTLGLLFALLGVTGSALVFYPQIDALLHPELRVEAVGQAPGWSSPVWDEALATVRMRWPDKTGPWRFEVTGEASPIPARYYDPPERAGRLFAPMMAWLSPDGREVLRRDYWGDYAMTWIYDLHMQLLAEATGKQVVGWSGVAMLVLLVSGLAVWWPKAGWRKALVFKRDAVPTRRLRDIHKLAGLASLLLLLILVATGVLLALPVERDKALAATLGPVAPLPAPDPLPGEGPPVSIARALAAAHRAVPDARLAWIETPGMAKNGGSGVYRFRVQVPGDPSRRFPHSYIFVDPRSAMVLAVHDIRRGNAASAVNDWLHPLHDASIGGLATRLLAVATGLAPLLLFVTGLLHWRRRTRARPR